MFLSRASAVRRRTRWWLLGIIAVITIAPTVFFAHRVLADDGKSHQHAFAITSDGKRLDLGIPKEYESGAAAVNNKNEVVGWVTLPDGTSHAFLSRDSKMTDLGTLEGGYAWASDINEAGQVVTSGTETASGKEHPFFWQNGKMTDMWVKGSLFRATPWASTIWDRLLTVTYPYKGTTSTTELGSVGYCRYFIWQNGAYIGVTGFA